MSTSERDPPRKFTGLRKNRFSLKCMEPAPVSMDDAAKGQSDLLSPTNVISFLDDGRACVIIFPFTPELTEGDWEMIDAASCIRFFVYAASDAPVPPGRPGGGGRFEDYYPVASVRSAIDRSTYMCAEILPVQKRSRQGLVEALMNLAATACSDDHRSAVLTVTDRPSLVEDYALCRPHALGRFR